WRPNRDPLVASNVMGAKVSTRAHHLLVTSFLLAGAGLLLFAAGDVAFAQTALPKIEVEKPKEAKRAPPAKKQVARPVRAPAPRPAAAPPAATPSPAERVANTNRDFDRARDQNILPKGGASAHTIDRAGIEASPQGENTPVDKLLL